MIEWLIAAYFASFMVVSVYTMALLVVIVRYRRYKAPASVDLTSAPPDVTVQLPVYNPERQAFTRCLDAIVRMSYPKQHLQIQVLDDSTMPEAVGFVQDACASNSSIETRGRATGRGPSPVPCLACAGSTSSSLMSTAYPHPTS